MNGTPWSDGVPGLTQRQIQPGCSFTYRWKATQYGSYWYHAHQHNQIDDGLYGPIVIHPRTESPNPFAAIAKNNSAILQALKQAEREVRPLVLGDLRHVTADETWEYSVAAGIEIPCVSSLLINGKGNVDCWSPEKIASLLSPVQKMYLALVPNSTFTAKG